jgi:large subunit ribosomal protein L37Ae
MVKKMETSQHAKYTCAFCGKDTVKRQAVGIWSCKSCKRTTAGGAYTVSYVSASTIARRPYRRVPLGAEHRLLT